MMFDLETCVVGVFFALILVFLYLLVHSYRCNTYIYGQSLGKHGVPTAMARLTRDSCSAAEHNFHVATRSNLWMHLFA